MFYAETYGETHGNTQWRLGLLLLLRPLRWPLCGHLYGHLCRHLCWLLLLVTNTLAHTAAAQTAATQLPSDMPAGVILQYHHVDSTTPAATSIDPARFKQHMALLVRGGYHVWPIERLIGALRQHQSVPDKVVVITFDDAYPSIYTHAFPLLRAHGWPFSIFVATQYIQATEGQFLSWAQLREMQAAGASIINHTHSHQHLLRRLSEESSGAWRHRVQAEITTAQQLLNQHLGVTDKLLAYPYGEYDTHIAQLAKQLGFVAFGQQSGAVGPDSDFAALPRFPLSGTYSDLDTLQTKLDTRPLPLHAGHTNPLLAHNVSRPSLTMSFTRDDLAFEQLTCYGPSGPTTITHLDAGRYSARSDAPVPVGRSRYNCTMPVGDTGRFYWFSQLWIRRNPDGSWYPEP
jgi:biofilm PGA synthesis lipoprotein PgaB